MMCLCVCHFLLVIFFALYVFFLKLSHISTGDYNVSRHWNMNQNHLGNKLISPLRVPLSLFLVVSTAHSPSFGAAFGVFLIKVHLGDAHIPF